MSEDEKRKKEDVAEKRRLEGECDILRTISHPRTFSLSSTWFLYQNVCLSRQFTKTVLHYHAASHYASLYTLTFCARLSERIYLVFELVSQSQRFETSNMAEEAPFPRITVVDFSAFSIAHQEVPGTTDPTVQQLVKDLYAGCSTLGFVYLTNHGIRQDEIDNVLQTMDTFFSLDSFLKEKYKKQLTKGWSGWEDVGNQTLNEKTGADLKEVFDISEKGYEEFVFPGDDLIPGFKSTVLGFRSRLSKLTDRVLTALAIGLDVNPEIFVSASRTEAPITTTFRFNYYPKLTHDVQVKPGQIRCGEHSDYGSITLLFQDDAGGLEIATEDGTFIPVTPIPGTVLVNIADLMQRWSSDRLKSVVHRVIIPEEQSKKAKSRQSIAYFVSPSDETVITCLDGSDKYSPIKAGQYITNKVENQYTY